MKTFICWILSKLFPFKQTYNIFDVAVESKPHKHKRSWSDLKSEEQKLNSKWR